MVIKNGNVLMDDWKISRQDIYLQDEIIAGFSHPAMSGGEEVFDASGLYVLPGLVDIHIHGCMGVDFCDAEENAIEKMAEYLLSRGVTSFLGTSMSYDFLKLQSVFETAKLFMEKKEAGGARLCGIHMEGPFFSAAKKGAQSGKYIVPPDISLFEKLQTLSGGNIRLVDVAPEMDGAMEFIAKISPSVTVSLAHTEADYETSAEAFRRGATHITHAFNAMPPFGHRDPGVIGAAFDAKAMPELICDGKHIHPSVIRSVFSWFTDEKVILISDAMRATGLSDGTYDLGGQEVTVFQNAATLKDGTLAGSVADLFTCFQNAVSFGIPLESAARAASFNPARAVGLSEHIGSITVGKSADILILDSKLQLKHVIRSGKWLENKKSM